MSNLVGGSNNKTHPHTHTHYENDVQSINSRSVYSRELICSRDYHSVRIELLHGRVGPSLCAATEARAPMHTARQWPVANNNNNARALRKRDEPMWRCGRCVRACGHLYGGPARIRFVAVGCVCVVRCGSEGSDKLMDWKSWAFHARDKRFIPSSKWYLLKHIVNIKASHANIYHTNTHASYQIDGDLSVVNNFKSHSLPPSPSRSRSRSVCLSPASGAISVALASNYRRSRCAVACFGRTPARAPK